MRIWKPSVRNCPIIAAVSREKKLNTIYLGGGTPTSLRADQLDRLFTHLEKQFSYEHLLELTVEAGRPDSITREKLKVLKRHGIGRISSTRRRCSKRHWIWLEDGIQWRM